MAGKTKVVRRYYHGKYEYMFIGYNIILKLLSSLYPFDRVYYSLH